MQKKHEIKNITDEKKKKEELVEEDNLFLSKYLRGKREDSFIKMSQVFTWTCSRFLISLSNSSDLPNMCYFLCNNYRSSGQTPKFMCCQYLKQHGKISTS